MEFEMHKYKNYISLNIVLILYIQITQYLAGGSYVQRTE